MKWDPVKSRKLFQALRDDKPLASHRKKKKAKVVGVSPQQIRVQVENGTKTAGLGMKVDQGPEEDRFPHVRGARERGRPRDAAHARPVRPAAGTARRSPWRRRCRARG